MTKTQKLLPALALALVFGGWALPAHANPSYFASTTATSAATTSPRYMTPGMGTSTTPVFDAYAQALAGGVTTKAESAGLLVQLLASSSATVANLSVEYSQDGIDWYRNFIIDTKQAGATSTPYTLVNPFSISWPFASSSVGGAAPTANSNRSTAALIIPTPFRYTRVVSSITGGSGAIWAQLIPIKERP